MMDRQPKYKKVNKRYSQIISKFKYYLEIFNNKCISTTKSSIFNRQTTIDNFEHHEELLGPSHYHYIKSKRQNLNHSHIMNQSILQKLADQHLTGNNVLERQLFKLKLDLKALIKKTEAIVITSNQEKHKMVSSNREQKAKSFINLLQSQSSSARIDTNRTDVYQLYLISIIEDSEHQANLLYLVERISINISHNPENDKQSNVRYQSIIGFRQQNPIMQIISKILFASKQKHILTSFKNSLQQKLNIFQSSLQKQLKLISAKNEKEEKLSHPEFKREDKLPLGQYKKFEKLKIQIYRYFKEINKFRQLNRYFLDNLICRFLKFRQYDYGKTLKSVKSYLDWQKYMRDTYTYESFDIFHKMNLYQLLGKDKQGRPVLFFRTYNVYPDQIKDLQHYYDYTFWMLDIFIQDHTEGYIDDFILIGNYEPFGTDNFKLQIAKQVANKANDLFPDRQYKLICFGLGTFTNFVFKAIKPFLPAFVLQKVYILGCDRNEVKQYLSQFMDLSILPQQIVQSGCNQIRQRSK